MVLKFEIDTDNLLKFELEDSIKDMELLIKFLCNANPNYYLIGSMLKEQLEAQVHKMNKLDPKQDMITQWDMILERDCECQSREDYVSLHDGIRDLVDNFYAQIGEAIGPVCYAGYQLAQELKKHSLSTEWVENCIAYYRDNWDF